MSIGTQKLYVTRINDETAELLLSEWKPMIKDGEENRNKVFRPQGIPFFCEMAIPNIFPDLKWEDGPQEVDVVDCDEETGLYMAIVDDYFGGESHLYNVRPKLVIDNGVKRYVMPYQDDDHPDDYPYGYWSLHVGYVMYPHHRESYDKVRNVKLVIKEKEV